MSEYNYSYILWPGEQRAVDMVLIAGEKYGYGNMIAHLRKAWAEMLIRKYGLSVETAINATNVRPYPIEEEDDGRNENSV